MYVINLYSVYNSTFMSRHLDVFFFLNNLQAVESAGIKFPDFKNSGVTLRSQRIKLPSSLGQKKMKGIEQMLNELRLGKRI